MLRTALILIGGLVAGFAIATWLPDDSAGDGFADDRGDALPSRSAEARAGQDPEIRLERLEAALRDETAERAALEMRIAELDAELVALREALEEQSELRREARGRDESPDQIAPAEGFRPLLRGALAARFGPNGGLNDREVERLIAAGFPADRAEWISRRTSELRMQALEAQYEARRGGAPLEPGALREPEQTLRSELGEADYERYLEALGRPTRVRVFNVLASSPAEQAGLRPGDEVVAYAGARVFDMRDLNRLTLQGQPGEPVVVDVLRDGERLQVVMPRGPVGVSAGGGRSFEPR